MAERQNHAPRTAPGCRWRRGALALLLALEGMVCAGGAKITYPKDTTTIEPGQQMENPPGWYRDAVIYQIWVKAFADGRYDDGIGDLPGILGKLDYLQSLGVNTLWLSPIFECAYKGMNMHGYDTTDYLAINDRFGGKADLRNLIDAVHARGMRILFDFVPNHTSVAHPWFDDPAKKTWYIWKDAIPEGWGFPWGGGDSRDVWKEGEETGYYYTSFPGMADLNLYNPAVFDYLKMVQRYWLDRGFDGLRMDAVRYLCEAGPRKAADTPDTHARLRDFRAVIDEYATGNAHPHPASDPARHSVKMMIAEAWTRDEGSVAQYYGNGSDECNMCMDFWAPKAVFNAINGHDGADLTWLWEYERDNYPKGARPATFDSNHDNLISRPGSQFAGDRAKIILAEALNLLSPNTPIIYYGNEVGMPGRAGMDLDLRQPMDWAVVQEQSAQPDSILSWCKYLIKARTTYPALRGAFAPAPTDLGQTKALAYVRMAGSERLLVVANLTEATETVVVKDLSPYGVPPDGKVDTIIGPQDPGEALKGSQFTVTALPPYGTRIYYLAGGAFRGTIHGDRK